MWNKPSILTFRSETVSFIWLYNDAKSTIDTLPIRGTVGAGILSDGRTFMRWPLIIHWTLNSEQTNTSTQCYVNLVELEKNIGSLQLIWTILKPHGPISGELPSITIMSFWALSCSPQNHQWGQQQLTFLGYTRGDVHKIHREFDKLRWKHHSSIQGVNKFQLFTNYVVYLPGISLKTEVAPAIEDSTNTMKNTFLL